MYELKHHICIRNYCKDKHNKFGIKFFTQESSDKGYIYDMIAYKRKSSEYDKKIGILPNKKIM